MSFYTHFYRVKAKNFNEIAVRIPKQDLQDMFQEHQNLP